MEEPIGKPWDIRLVTPYLGTDAGRHYTTNAINGDAMEILRTFKPDDINWVFLSTSGVHGTYCSLDDVEWRLWDGGQEEVRKELFGTDDPEYQRPTEADVTVLIVLPRMVTTFYGNAVVRTRDDVALLRKRVEQTIAGIAKLQAGNREKSEAAE